MKKFLLILLFITITPINLGVSLFALSHLPKPKPVIASYQPPAPSQLFTSLPPETGEVQGIYTVADARPIIIEKYLAKYDSPLLPYATALLEASEKYDVDYQLIVAIAQCESNLCKKIPNGSYNCWGWANGEARFDSWEDAFEQVAKTLKEDYLDRGLDTPEKIMPKYAPPSVEKGGPWAKCVSQFINDLTYGEID